MSKDQAIGGLIFIVCVVVMIGYAVALFWERAQNFIARLFQGIWPTVTAADARLWLVAVPVFVAFIAVLGIGAWIGWTMATTPPPKPIEEIEAEEKKEEKKTEEEKEK